jgi:hypothetical protein
MSFVHGVGVLPHGCIWDQVDVHNFNRLQEWDGLASLVFHSMMVIQALLLRMPGKRIIKIGESEDDGRFMMAGPPCHIINLPWFTGITNAVNAFKRWSTNYLYQHHYECRATIIAGILHGPANAAACERLAIDAAPYYFGLESVCNRAYKGGDLSLLYVAISYAGEEPEDYNPNLDYDSTAYRSVDAI